MASLKKTSSPDVRAIARGAVQTIGLEDLERKMKQGKKLRVKHGWDPTAGNLHLGYTVPYQVLRRFQDLGHTVIFLVGDFTTTIGDPTDRDITRPVLSESTIKKNMEEGLKQIGKVLDISKLEIRRNSEWYADMTLKDFFNIAKRVTAVHLWERDMFQERLKKGGTVYTHEFLYPLLQAYDSVMLKSDLTVIGNDQYFNELVARDLQKNYGQDGQAIIAMPILPGMDGKRKMGQSLGNYIGITESPSEQYGKIMSIPDSVLELYYTLLTHVSLEDIHRMKEEMEGGVLNPRDAKMRLGHEIVMQYHGEKKAAEAAKAFSDTFQAKQMPASMPTITIHHATIPLVDLLIEAKLASSKTESRRLIRERSVSINNVVIDDEHHTAIIPSEGVVIKKGKRHFVTILAKH